MLCENIVLVSLTNLFTTYVFTWNQYFVDMATKPVLVPHPAEAHRQFYNLENAHEHSKEEGSDTSTEDLLRYIDQNVIGRDKQFSGPFGLRKGKARH